MKAAALLLLTTFFLGGCGSAQRLAYSPEGAVLASTRHASFFAQGLCVTAGDVENSGIALSERTCAGLFDVTTGETLCAQNVYERVHPASLAKIMTALIAIENGDLTKTIVATANVGVRESGAQTIGLKEGDRMTLDQALHILLIYSANDVANFVAEGVAGSIERFAVLMNERARSLGATGCHFTNPHGLTDSGQYVTTYDLYLIFNAAMQYQEFREIIDTAQYASSYRRSDGTEVPVSISATNGFLTGAWAVPEGVTILGGKTGTTAAAGHCLIPYFTGRTGEEYVAVVMRTPDAATLQKEMTALLQNAAG